MKKKAQVQMAESIGVIIVVTLIILFAIILYSKINSQGINAASQTQRALSAVQLAQKVSALPELACSSTTSSETSCIDYHKAIAFSNHVQKEEFYAYYSYYFGNGRLELQILFPDYATESMLLYENNATSTRQQTSIPVLVPYSVSNSITRERYFGVLVITSYSD